MAERQLPPVETLRNLLRYDAETGNLFWLERDPQMFNGRTDTAAAWNSRCAGKEALAYIDSWGYKVGNVGRKRLAAHRAVWALHHGRWPEGEIDHINGEKTDNRIANLRVVSRAENAANLPHRKDNTTGLMGVKRNSAGRGWEARISRGGRQYHLGLYKTFGEAAAARNAGEILLGFHKNHARGGTLVQAEIERLLKSPLIADGGE